MRVQFWGVRGAIATPGHAYLRYGGNTCCTAITGAQGELVVIDAGTGFCQLGDALMHSPFGRGQGEMVLLISHTHWDHLLGLPFPGIIHQPGNRFIICGPDSARGSLETICNGLLSPTYSPVYSLANMGGEQIFHAMTTDPFHVGGLTIRAWPLPYDEATSIQVYRIEEGTQSLVYITDINYTSSDLMDEAAAYAHKATLLIHSAPYMRNEPIQRYGFCHVEDALYVALQAHVSNLLLFQHAPTRTDDQMDALVAHYRGLLDGQQVPLHLDAARERLVLEL